MGIQIFVLFSESYIQKKTFKVGSHCELRSTKERQALTLSVSRKILLVHKIYTHTQKNIQNFLDAPYSQKKSTFLIFQRSC